MLAILCGGEDLGCIWADSVLSLSLKRQGWVQLVGLDSFLPLPPDAMGPDCLSPSVTDACKWTPFDSFVSEMFSVVNSTIIFTLSFYGPIGVRIVRLVVTAQLLLCFFISRSHTFFFEKRPTICFSKMLLTWQEFDLIFFWQVFDWLPKFWIIIIIYFFYFYVFL